MNEAVSPYSVLCMLHVLSVELAWLRSCSREGLAHIAVQSDFEEKLHWLL